MKNLISNLLDRFKKVSPNKVFKRKTVVIEPYDLEYDQRKQAEARQKEEELPHPIK